jgi:chromosome segregation ATPase
MGLDGLSEQFVEFVGRARAVLSQEITAAKNIAGAAKAETATAQATLADLQNQHKQAKSQLDVVNNELQRRTTLAGINREITAARKQLEVLKVETAETEKALAALHKQRTEGEAKLVALNNEAQRMIGIRTEGEAVMAKLRSQVAQVQWGR